MDPILHTLLATGALIVSFYAGKHFGRGQLIEDTVITMLDELERDGYVATKQDKNGDKELVLISTVTSKALRTVKT